MPEDDFKYLIEQPLLSPTAFNLQHWRVVRVQDLDQRQAIKKLAWDQLQVTDASELLILYFDKNTWEKEPQRYWHNAPADVQSFIIPAITQYYQGCEQVQHDEGMRSCGIFAMAIMLIAQSMDYDICPMDGFDFDAVAKHINLPADHEICMMLAIGKSAAKAWPKPGQLTINDVIVNENF